MVRLISLLIVVTLLVGAVTVAVRLGDEGGGDHPEAWDPRVADLAGFVEGARDLDFDHPVHVDFLTPEEYTDATTTEVGDLQDEELAELERGSAELRALGVASGPLDLAAALNQTIDAGTLAFYSPEEKRIRIRGTELTVGLRVTLVHELTHALQDQHFDLGDFLEDGEDSSAALARRALGEGDAMRVESVYIDEVLTAEEQAAYQAEAESDLERSEAATADIPAFIQATFAVPYALGRPFVQMLFNDGGNGAVDDAFDDPPSTEEHLFDPASFLAGEEAAPVDLGLDDDVEIRDEGPFGSPTWYLVLAERIDPRTALDATLGWAGDEYAVYERDGTTCIRAVFRGEDAEEEAEMAAAIDAWVTAMPGGRAAAIDVAGRPGLDACDPGPDVDLQVTGRSIDVLALPNVWAHLVAGTVADLGPDTSRCWARHVLDDVSYERLSGPGDSEVDRDMERAAFDALAACRSGDR